MKRRCYTPTSGGYSIYGGRGIRVCDRWRNSFEAFYADMGPRPSAKHSLDRIDVDGNYEPGNCRWATHGEQSWNRRQTIPNETVRRAKEMLSLGSSHKEISRTLGISTGSVSKIYNGARDERPEVSR